MANTLFDKGRQDFLEGNTPWLTSNIRAMLVSSAWSPAATGNAFLPDVPRVCIVASSVLFSSKTSTNGAADAADITFPSVSGVNNIPYLVIFKDTNVYTTSPLIALIDTASGLPVTANGGDLGVTWDNGNTKIFLL